MALEDQSNNSGEDSFGEEILVIKVCFHAQSTNQRGAGLIRIPATQRRVDRIEAVASTAPDYTGNLTSLSPVYDFYKFIYEKRGGGDTQPKSTGEFNSALQRSIDSSGPDTMHVIASFVKYARKGDIQPILDAVTPQLHRAFYDKKIEVDLGIEFVSSLDLDSFIHSLTKPNKQDEKPAAPKGDSFFQIGSEKTLVECLPVLSPIGGIPISLLRAGTEIMVRLDPSTPLGAQYNQIFGLIKDDGRHKPRAAQVEAIHSGEKEYKILVHFEKNIYGKIVETEPIKLRLANEEDPSTVPVSGASRWITVALIAGTLLVLGVLGWILFKK